MTRLYLMLFILVLLPSLEGQTFVSFRVDMQTLIENNLFTPAVGEKVFVRGNFNQWQGNEHELIEGEDEGIFTAIFNLNANSGDTLEYKFVIQRNSGGIYWERNPNPGNPNHGNRIWVMEHSPIILPLTRFNYDEYILYPVLFGKDKLREDFVQMRTALEETHPALYDYTAKTTLDSLFDHVQEQIDTTMSFEDFYRLTSTVIARIGCGHTKLWVAADYWNITPEQFFPLILMFTGQDIFVRGFYADSGSIPLGSKILAINNQPVKEIIENLKVRSSSDGFIEAFRTASVEKNFSKKYALFYGYPESFQVAYIAPGEITVNESVLRPVSVQEINKVPVRGKELSLRLLKDSHITLLTINTFAYYDQREMFQNFLDSTFLVIREKKIEHLIIDLRGNDGGDPYCSSYLLSYIEREPVPYFSEPYGHDESLSQPLPRAANHFTGDIYTLIDGDCFSTTGHLCALLKYHRIGKLVGAESGATYTCTDRHLETPKLKEHVERAKD